MHGPGADARWRNFTHGISGAFSSLFKSTNEAILPGLSPEQQPIVTIMESMDENLPVGTRMALSEAETRIGELNRDYWDSDEPELIRALGLPMIFTRGALIAGSLHGFTTFMGFWTSSARALYGSAQLNMLPPPSRIC